MLMSYISNLVIVVIGITQHQRNLLKHQLSSLTDALTQTKIGLHMKKQLKMKLAF